VIVKFSSDTLTQISGGYRGFGNFVVMNSLRSQQRQRGKVNASIMCTQLQPQLPPARART
jgi:hypothetical protein